MQWLSLISTVLSWILIGALLLGRRWFEAKIEKGVEHKFNEKLENFRADLRNKEAEISALRDGVLSGRAQRQALLDKRRFEADDSLHVQRPGGGDAVF